MSQIEGLPTEGPVDDKLVESAVQDYVNGKTDEDGLEERLDSYLLGETIPRRIHRNDLLLLSDVAPATDRMNEDPECDAAYRFFGDIYVKDDDEEWFVRSED